MTHVCDQADRVWRSSRMLFDMDGVLVDTNHLKAENIRRAAAYYCDGDTLDRFVEKFVAGNGLPRELKVSLHFSSPISDAILEQYKAFNAATLMGLRPLDGVKEFLKVMREKEIPGHVFTGGGTDESIAILKSAGIYSYFTSLHGGPRTKEQNFRAQDFNGQMVYFGDSQHDYEFARQCGIQFVYVYGHSSWSEGRHLMASHSDVVCIHSFRELTHCSQWDRG